MEPRYVGCFTAIAVTVFSVQLASAVPPTWAKKAVAFPSQCEIGSSGASVNDSPRTALGARPPITACRPIRIASPDGKNVLEVKYRKMKLDLDDAMMVASFRVRSQDGTWREAEFPAGFQNIDLLWSPDSRSFFVNGGNGGGYWGFWVYVYRLEDPDLKPIDITGPAQQDMVKSFPPCMASGMERETCRSLEKEPDFNMTGIDWDGTSFAVVVMAEVPCTGGYDGIMCQVMGYKLEVPTGKIIVRMTSRQLARDWQKSMAWKFHNPDPPEYCDDHRPIPNCPTRRR